MGMKRVLQTWKALWAANAFSSTEEFSAGIILVGSPDRRHVASMVEVKISIGTLGTDDTEINVYSAPVTAGVVGTRDAAAKDAFVIATSNASPTTRTHTILIDPRVVGSGCILGVKALGATVDMEITASYQLYRGD